MKTREGLQTLIDQAALNNRGLSISGRWECDGPIRLPDQPFTLEGSGIESTDSIFSGGSDGLVVDKRTFYTNMPVVVRRQTLSQRGQGGTAIGIDYPAVASVNESTAILDELTLRPSPTLGTRSTWETLIRLSNGWNARLNNIWGHADNSRLDPAQPFPLKTAVHFRGCQDAQATGLCLYGGMEIGILIEADALGRGEGILLERGAIVHARIGVKAVSTLPRGEPTPWQVLSHYHIYHHGYGVLFVNRSEPTIHDNNIYASKNTQSGVGIYLVGGRDHQVHHNTIWNLTKQGGHAIVVDNVSGAMIESNRIYSNYIGVWLTSSTRNCVVRGNRIAGDGLKFAVVDHGVGNLVEL